MKHASVLLALLVAGLLGMAAVSCGAESDAEVVGPVPTASVPEEATPASPATETEAGAAETGGEGKTETSGGEHPATVAYEVWFTRGESLFAASRTREWTPRVGTAALESLLAGPAAAERRQGVSSQVPPGTRLLGLTIADGIATVDLSSEFESGGGSLSMTTRLAQVVYTITQFPTVEGVLFKLDGRPVDVFSGEGIVLDHPVGRGDYGDLLPAILVRAPLPGERVSNPVRVAGSANVFEANVTVRVLDAAGREVGGTFTTATCGTGCRGSFSVAVAYEVEREQSGTLVVHDDDAAGVGRPPHEVRIPVTLTPRAQS